MIRLTLYTTLGCHLCERLEAELACLGHNGIQLERVEIADDERLIEHDGTRIPVLRDEQGADLDQGFEPERLRPWLAARDLLARSSEPDRVESQTTQHGARQVRGRRFLN